MEMTSPLFGAPSNQNKFSTPNSLFSAEASKSTPTSSSYLPGFLLGNVNSPAPAFGRSLSTAGYQTSSPSKMSSKSPPRQSGYPYTSPVERKKKRMTSSNASSQDGAPPTESLYSSSDIVSSSTNEAEALKKDMLNSTSDSILSRSILNKSVFSPRPETIPQSPAQIDPFYSQGEAISSNDVLDDTAVTVFGFPPAASSFILQQFAQYGTVEKHEIHNTGNWLHLKYQNKIQAKKALSKNGKIFARTIMIGVLPCIKKEIAHMEAELNTTAPGTPNITLNKTSSMRPLANSTSARVNTPITNDKGTPKKSDSVIGKAFDYVFG